MEATQQPASESRRWHNKRTRGRHKGRQCNNQPIFCHAAITICSVVICCLDLLRNFGNSHCCLLPHHFDNRWHCPVYSTDMALCGIVVCRTATAKCGIIFGCAAMAIGSVLFLSLTATRIRGIVFCHGTLVISIVVFHQATLAVRGIVICCTTTTMRGKHYNQPKECVAKMPATKAKQQATTSQ
jgi:hypothetical protein